MIKPTIQADFYKMDHKSQYPEKTTKVYSNLTARSSRVKGVNEIVFFGLQYFIKEYLIEQWNREFFKKAKSEVINHYKRMMDYTLGKDAVSAKNLEDLHDLGYLPLRISALPEGSRVPLKVPPVVFESSDKNFAWLTNYVETIKSCILWGPITSATTADRYKEILTNWCNTTGGIKDLVQWQGHDFSMRGMFGLEAACLSGAAHLLSFTGTDTIPAIEFLEKYYGANIERELVGSSVYATEHSVMCAGGRDNEFETYKRLITKVYPKGIVSIVSDTWDLWNVVTNYLPKLKSDILARDGKVVIRPDSGDPVSILCGLIEAKDSSAITRAYPSHYWGSFFWKDKGGKYFKVKPASQSEIAKNEVYEASENECKGLIELLWEIFGGTTNDKGFRTLDSHIGAIYGDSITPERAQDICMRLAMKKFTSSNVVLGIGSYTYQYVTRDTYGIAIKATYCEVDGQSREIFKDPATDNGTKRSAKGLLAVTKNKDGVYELKDQATREEADNCDLKVVFENGKLVKETTLAEIRSLLAKKYEAPTVKETSPSESAVA